MRQEADKFSESFAALAPSPSDTVSACLVVRHEETVIDRCLQSLRGVVDEIIVVHDGPCEDGSLDIARRHGARVFERPLAGHSEAHRPFVYERARGEWLLRIDGDEFLSEELRRELPSLVRRTDVDGYEVLWPIWTGGKCLDPNAPWRLVLFRRSVVSLLGMIHEHEHVRGHVERVPVRLEHRPLYDNYGLQAMATKWRRWARIHAAELTSPVDDLPKFNLSVAGDWPPKRKVLNWVGPLLLPAYAAVLFVTIFWHSRKDWSSSHTNARMAFAQTAYMCMVQLYVARRQLEKLLTGARQ